MNTWNTYLKLLDTMPTLHLALGLLAITTFILGIAFVSARLLGRGPQWRSLMLRSLTAVAAAAVLGDLLVQVVWSPGQVYPLPITITTTSPAALPVSVVMHPHELPTTLTQSDLDLDASQNLPNRTDGAPGAVSGTVAKGSAHPFDRSALLNTTVLILWFAIVAQIAARQTIGRLKIWNLYRRSTQVDDSDVKAEYDRLCRAAGLGVGAFRRPKLFASRAIDSPFVTGPFSMTIFLPEDVLQSGDRDKREAMVAHELAHARRCDPLFLLLIQFLCAVCWFQPLVWRLAKELESSAEECADAEVIVLARFTAVRYADLLCRIAEGRVDRFTESVAGIGMLPNRSMLTRRLKGILEGAGLVAERISGVQRIGLSALLLILFCGSIAACVIRYVPAVAQSADFALRPTWQTPSGYRDDFVFAKQRSWDIGPTIAPPDDAPPRGTVPPIAAAMTPVDRALVNRLNGLSFLNTSGPGWHPEIGQRKAIEQILAAHPEFFYGEEMLSAWYDKNGQEDLARRWHERALIDAPEVLAGRVQFDDGRPVSGFRFGLNMRLFTSWGFVEQGYGPVNYTALTDDRGCFYLPVFSGVAGQVSYSWSEDNSGTKQYSELMRDFSFEQEGINPNRFMQNTRIGVIAPFLLRPHVAFLFNGVAPQPFGKDAPGSDANHPLVLHGTSALATWQAFPGATQYGLQLFETVKTSNGSTSREVQSPNTVLTDEGANQTKFPLDISSGGPGFLDGRQYSVNVNALYSVSHPGYLHSILLSNSNLIYFTVADVPRVLPLTPDAIKGIAGEDITIEQLLKTPKTVKLVLVRRRVWNDENWLDRNLFGYPKYTHDVELVSRAAVNPNDVLYRTTIAMSR